MLDGMKRNAPFFAVLALLAACVSPPDGGTQPAAMREAFSSLQRGMTASEVVALCGEPAARRPLHTDLAEGAEVWTYRQVVSVQQRQVAVTTHEVPYFDPFTGMQRNIPEPTYQLETVRTVRTIEVVMLGGRLLNWRITAQEEERSLL
jgi:outer membrane protein assembly factor BamE (lipoprotein component of BamABCDE complex)